MDENSEAHNENFVSAFKGCNGVLQLLLFIFLINIIMYYNNILLFI